MRFANLRIARKLGLAFLVLVAVAAGMGVVLYGSMKTVETARTLTDGKSGEIASVLDARGALTRQENSLRGFMLTRDEYYAGRVKKHYDTFSGHVAALRAILQTDPDAIAKIDKLEAAVAAWHEKVADPIIALSRNPETYPRAIELLTSGLAGEYIDPAEEVLDGLRAAGAEAIIAYAATQAEASWRAELALVGGMALLVLIAVGMGGALVRGIAAPVNRLRDAMNRIAAGDNAAQVPGFERRDEIGDMAKAVEGFKQAAVERARLEGEAVSMRDGQAVEAARRSASEQEKTSELRAFVSDIEGGFERLARGDLTVRLENAGASEFEPIRQKFNTSVAALEGAVGSVVSSIGAIRNGLSEITVASSDLAQRTEQQAARLEETVAALSEVTGAVQETARSAGQAHGAAATTKASAERGGEIVSRAVQAMAQIEKGSQQINRIIAVIDEIAFQTNLLALNAGVEAARAGEAGRGFAVVAQEVRGLAQRSAEAAKEIKELISTSQTQVEAGVELVTASGRQLAEIVGQVGAVSEVVSRIAASAKDQAKSLKDVSTAADQMDKVTQQNAAMVEEATAAAKALASETAELADLVGGFRTKTGGGRSPAPRIAVGATPAPARPGAVAPSRTAMQMKTTGRTGGAQAKPAPNEDGWEEF